LEYKQKLLFRQTKNPRQAALAKPNKHDHRSLIGGLKIHKKTPTFLRFNYSRNSTKTRLPGWVSRANFKMQVFIVILHLTTNYYTRSVDTYG